MTESKAILITGCSSGIGLCVATGLQQQGYRVFASARKNEDVTKLRKQGFESVLLDLADSSSISTAVETVLTQTDGKLFALFNNAAYGQPGAVEDLSRKVLQQQFETNLFGTHELTNLVIPIMRQQGYGRIIQNSSVLGLAALPYRGAYNASKFALEGLSDTLRMELKGTGIHVSIMEPGPIESKFRANSYAKFKQNIDREHSAHRDYYPGVEARLAKQGHTQPFTLQPDAVLRKVVHALESPHPKARYYITVPTYLFGYARRLLSTRLLDKILLKASSGENK
jgi:NAD(P)-dependent dehydrogenase (short-subunit alcohol dehydrogenase family)